MPPERRCPPRCPELERPWPLPLLALEERLSPECPCGERVLGFESVFLGSGSPPKIEPTAFLIAPNNPGEDLALVGCTEPVTAGPLGLWLRLESFVAGRRLPSLEALDEDGRLDRVRSREGDSLSLLFLSALGLSVLGFSESDRFDSEDLLGDSLGLWGELPESFSWKPLGSTSPQTGAAGVAGLFLLSVWGERFQRPLRLDAGAALVVPFSFFEISILGAMASFGEISIFGATSILGAASGLGEGSFFRTSCAALACGLLLGL